MNLKRDNKSSKKTNKQAALQEKRRILAELSNKARQYREERACEAARQGDADLALSFANMPVNEVIKKWYREQTGAKTFKTFRQWQEAGYSVMKGSKAFLLWSRKRQVISLDPEAEEYEFFPIAFMFSDLQVEQAEQ